MKRRFRITITPDTNWETFSGLRAFIRDNWGLGFHSDKVLFKGFLKNEYVAGIEIKQAKQS